MGANVKKIYQCPVDGCFDTDIARKYRYPTISTYQAIVTLNDDGFEVIGDTIEDSEDSHNADTNPHEALGYTCGYGHEFRAPKIVEVTNE